MRVWRGEKGRGMLEEELVHLYVISAIRLGGKCGLAGTGIPE